MGNLQYCHYDTGKCQSTRPNNPRGLSPWKPFESSKIPALRAEYGDNFVKVVTCNHGEFDARFNVSNGQSVFVHPSDRYDPSRVFNSNRDSRVQQMNGRTYNTGTCNAFEDSLRLPNYRAR
ncbi:MAG: hypothetical protein SFU25_05535 [Candidatus Caenarcaniphilales bacterium]|nr:hypothetical protein [Candidatus Caenarcaniphilales bacterium]